MAGTDFHIKTKDKIILDVASENTQTLIESRFHMQSDRGKAYVLEQQ